MRDFIYFPLLQLWPGERERQLKNTRESYPTLFPAGYRFAKNNPIFADSREAKLDEELRNAQAPK
jgi:hypothetical protein